jgi:hypothetical protein
MFNSKSNFKGIIKYIMVQMWEKCMEMLSAKV